MAEIVIGLGTSHSPQLSLTPETWPLHAENDKRNPHLYGLDGIHHTYEEVLDMADASIEKQLDPELWQKRYDICQNGIATVSQKLAEANVDAVIVIGDDQEEVFQEDNFPAVAVYWGDTISNIPDSLQAPLRRAAWSYGLEEKEYPIARDLASHMLSSLSEQEFDVARSRYFRKGQGMGHAFSFIYTRIMQDKLIPMVPVMLNTYFPPNQPTPKRSYNLGQAIRNAVEEWDSDARGGGHRVGRAEPLRHQRGAGPQRHQGAGGPGHRGAVRAAARAPELGVVGDPGTGSRRPGRRSTWTST